MHDTVLGRGCYAHQYFLSLDSIICPIAQCVCFALGFHLVLDFSQAALPHLGQEMVIILLE